MKRLLAGCNIPCCSLAAVPAARRRPNSSRSCGGAGRKCCVRTPGVRRWCISGASPAALARSSCRCSGNSPSEIDVVMISADLVQICPVLRARCWRRPGSGGGELAFQRRFCRTPPVRDRPGLAGRDPAHAADRAGRNGHHDRGFGGNAGPRKMAGPAKKSRANKDTRYCEY